MCVLQPFIVKIGFSHAHNRVTLSLNPTVTKVTVYENEAVRLMTVWPRTSKVAPVFIAFLRKVTNKLFVASLKIFIVLNHKLPILIKDD